MKILTKYQEQLKNIIPDGSFVIVNNPQTAKFKYLKEYYKFLHADFPLKSELPTLKEFTQVLEKDHTPASIPKFKKGESKENWIFIIKNKKPIATINFDLLCLAPEVYAGLIIFIHTKKECRGLGLGELLLNLAEDLIKKELLPAQKIKWNLKHLKYIGLFAEINDLKKMADKNKNYKKYQKDNKKLLNFWHKMKFKKIDFNYNQPSFGAGAVPILSLIYKSSATVKSIPQKTLINFLERFTEFTISNKTAARRDPTLNKMEKELKGRKKIKLTNLK